MFSTGNYLTLQLEQKAYYTYLDQVQNLIAKYYIKMPYSNHIKVFRIYRIITDIVH